MFIFFEFGVFVELVVVFVDFGKIEVFVIQCDIFFDFLVGCDFLGCGCMGSGKIIVFVLLFVVCFVVFGGQCCVGFFCGFVFVFICEFVMQIVVMIVFFVEVVGLCVIIVFGGVSQCLQEQVLCGGVDIVVVCFGWFEDFMKQQVVCFSVIEVIVFDEVDYMVDFGFLFGVMCILLVILVGGQCFLFSVMLDCGIDIFVCCFFLNVVSYEVDEESVFVGEMMYCVLVVDFIDNKIVFVCELVFGIGWCIFFICIKYQVKKFVKQFIVVGIFVVDLYGNLFQNVCECNFGVFFVVFEDGGVWVLVVIDVVVCGVYVDNVDFVVYVDLFVEYKVYLYCFGCIVCVGVVGIVVIVVFFEQCCDVKDLFCKVVIFVFFEDVMVVVVIEFVFECVLYVCFVFVQVQQQQCVFLKQCFVGGEWNGVVNLFFCCCCCLCFGGVGQGGGYFIQSGQLCQGGCSFQGC